MIKIECLNKYYNKNKSNEVHVINNTSLTLADTGLVCILGESGSGKTTLMNTISGLDDFTDGTIGVDDISVNKYGSKQQERMRNDKFGYIFQNYYLLQDRTVEYNIMLSLSLYEVSDEEKEERIDYVLEAVDMLRFKKRLVSQLSGGQQQRIAIARALAKMPKIIFADEPTGNLDEVNTMKTMSILKKVSKECLVVVVTHEKSLAEFFADRILTISDGRIVDDKQKTEQSSYEYSNDVNIYLQEYDKKEYNHENIKIDTYSNEEIPDIQITLICENGKIYIQPNTNARIELLTDENEKKVIDDKRPKVEMTDVEDFEYSLKPLQASRIPKLGMKETMRLAFLNIKMMGKKQIFLIASLLVMSVMVVLTLQDILAVISINEQEVVTTDSNYVKVTMEKNAMIDSKKYNKSINEMLDSIRDNSIGMEIGVIPEPHLSYQYSGFWQIESKKTQVTGYSLSDIERISEEDLKYGEVPNDINEVVIDVWVLENFINAKTEVANLIPDVKHFLGKEILVEGKTEPIVVVGISDTGKPNVYMDKIEILSISSWNKSTQGLKKLQAKYAGEYDDIKLENSQVLVNESMYNEMVDSYISKNYRGWKEYEDLKKRLEEDGGAGTWMEGHQSDGSWGEYYVSNEERLESQEVWAEMETQITYKQYKQLLKDVSKFELSYKVNSSIEYEVVGFFPDEFGTNVVMSDDSYNYLLDALIIHRNQFYVYAEDKEAAVKFINEELSESVTENVNCKAIDVNEEELAQVKAAREIKFDTRIIVTITILIITLVILYFMMKASAVQRIGDIGVYRLLGIAKSSIVGLFAFEALILTSYTSLVGILLTTMVTKFISSIPALEIEKFYPWYMVILTIVVIYILNIVISIIPIRKLLKLPPAQLASKYDI